MLDSTLSAIGSIFKTDPSITTQARSKMLAYLRAGGDLPAQAEAPTSEQRIIRRKAAANRLGISTRAIDYLAAQGILPKRRLPGRLRACGFLESDLVALMTGEQKAAQ
jgi:predicted DNA-binding transcriptional regulator AlpA